MKATDCIKSSLEISHMLTMGLIQDMKDAPLAAASPDGNHTLWILGHLIYAEGALISEIMLGETHPVASWKGLFDGGTQPATDASTYPSFDELLTKYAELRAYTHKVLDGLSDEDLDSPCKACPPQFENLLTSYAQCFIAAALHAMHHRGQIAGARRALGRKPLMA